MIARVDLMPDCVIVSTKDKYFNMEVTKECCDQFSLEDNLADMKASIEDYFDNAVENLDEVMEIIRPVVERCSRE